MTGTHGSLPAERSEPAQEKQCPGGETERVVRPVDEAEKAEIIKKSGAWYIYNDEKLGQGKENTREFLKKNPKILKDIEKKVKESLKSKE